MSAQRSETFSTVLGILDAVDASRNTLARQHGKQLSRRFSGEAPTGFGDLESEPERARRMVDEAHTAAFAAELATQPLPSTERAARALALIADAQVALEDASALLSMDADGEPL